MYEYLLLPVLYCLLCFVFAISYELSAMSRFSTSRRFAPGYPDTMLALYARDRLFSM